MLAPKNVIYGFCKTTHPPKPKYMISLYRSEELNIVACFTTSQNRAGVPSESIKHGRITNEKKEVLSYVFLPEVSVGKTPLGEVFHFPVQTVVRFDYCFKKKNKLSFYLVLKIQKWFVRLMMQNTKTCYMPCIRVTILR